MTLTKVLQNLSMSTMANKSFRILENTRSNRVSKKAMIAKFKTMYRYTK